MRRPAGPLCQIARYGTFAAALLAAGCQKQPEAAAADPLPAPAPHALATPAPSPGVTATVAPLATLAGAWRVAGIDGAPLDEPYGLALTATDDLIWWEPRCAGMVRRYDINGSRIALGPVSAPRAPLTSDGGPAPPPPVCTIGLPPRLRDVMAALDAAETIVRTPENGLRIAGGGRSLTLFSQ